MSSVTPSILHRLKGFETNEPTKSGAMPRNDVPMQRLGDRNPRMTDVFTIEQPYLTRPAIGEENACQARENNRQKRSDAQIGLLGSLANGCAFDRLAGLNFATWKVPTVRHPRICGTAKEQ